MTDLDLCWAFEEACANGWPARRIAVSGGWMLRMSGGRMRRPNSLVPLNGPRDDPRRIIGIAESIYRAHGQAPIFRIPSFADEMDALLDEDTYPREGRSLTIAGPLYAFRSSETDVAIATRPSAAWLASRHRLTGDEGTLDAPIFEGMLSAIVFPTAFASISREGKIASLAYAVLQDKLLVVESVVTDSEHRGRGLARRTLSALFAWGRHHGADMACLQVIADNEPVLRLYRGLGLDRDVFAYHYRRGELAIR
ncbi:MAG: GNAT family N-acetyltransferase [Rhizobiaceae bacterium]|nr:GNAT family N-acetyltransferase [Rhizobiaceae bacterium]